ncbi:MAG: hydroxyacid dehydrogenase [Patescibacteria group bacterium]|nr:hydroxyacid dehydrogenase [Patescibacteria group bacterium]
MKIAFFELEEWETDYLKKELGAEVEAVYSTDKLTEENVGDFKDVEAISIFIYSFITKEILDKLPNLKFIATMSTGFDHINLAECKKRGVEVANVPYYGENTVAEHAFALILAISRKLFESVERVKKEDFSLDGLRGFDLSGKTLGVIGTGHIGQHVIRMGKGFEMNIIASDPYPNEKAAKKLGFKYVSLEELLKASDVVTLHAPYCKETHHLVNKENIKLVKKGAVIINTARGGLIETEALVQALESGVLGGVGLDVLEEEVMIKEEKELLSKHYNKEEMKIALEDHILIHDPRAIVTPHNAFNSEEALKRILDTTVENIKAYSQNKELNLVKA